MASHHLNPSRSAAYKVPWFHLVKVWKEGTASKSECQLTCMHNAASNYEARHNIHKYLRIIAWVYLVDTFVCLYLHTHTMCIYLTRKSSASRPLNPYITVNTFIPVHMYVYMHTHTHTHTCQICQDVLCITSLWCPHTRYTHSYTHSYIYVYIYIYIYIYIYTHTHIYIHTHTDTYSHVYIPLQARLPRRVPPVPPQLLLLHGFLRKKHKIMNSGASWVRTHTVKNTDPRPYNKELLLLLRLLQTRRTIMNQFMFTCALHQHAARQRGVHTRA